MREPTSKTNAPAEAALTSANGLGADQAVYTMSAAEMDRRRRAYTTFIVSLLAGIALSSVDYLLAAPAVWLACLAGLALALALSALAFARASRGYSRIEIRLTGSCIERTRGTASEKYALADIVGLTTKRTSRRSIREITARSSDGRRLGMNGVEDFERLEQELRSRIPASAAITETREPVDYDHPLFYVVFGGLMGLAFTMAIRAMSSLSRGSLKWTTLGIAGYSLGMGIFVLLARPIAQRYGPKSRFGDFLLGLFALLSGAALAIHSLVSSGR
jgi:hypothetical protein